MTTKFKKHSLSSGSDKLWFEESVLRATGNDLASFEEKFARRRMNGIASGTLSSTRTYTMAELLLMIRTYFLSDDDFYEVAPVNKDAFKEAHWRVFRISKTALARYQAFDNPLNLGAGNYSLKTLMTRDRSASRSDTTSGGMENINKKTPIPF